MISLFKVHLPESVDAPLLETLHSGFVGQGPRVDQFEAALVPWVGNERTLTVNSGTSALHLALQLAGVGPGDRVISSPMTCMATNTPIVQAGAQIVWADIDPHTGNIDPESIPETALGAIRHPAKAIVAVHFGGYPVDLEALYDIAEEYGMRLIEDAAHAFGAEYHDAKIGSGPDLCAFSFQAIKSLTTVDGGLLTCSSQEDYKRGKLLRWYGIDRDTPRGDFRCEADVPEAGDKLHMNDVAATIGLAQLPYTESIIAKAQMNAAYYTREIRDRKLRHVKALDYQADRKSAHWLYTVFVDDRASFMAHMEAKGIQTSQVHKRNDVQSCFKHFWRELPGVDEFSAKQVSIPVGWWVSRTDRAKIMNAIEAWDRSKK